jgi:hypothetical protein
MPSGSKPLSGGAWRYSAADLGSGWQVIIHDPNPCVRGGGFLVVVDRSSGKVLEFARQR